MDVLFSSIHAANVNLLNEIIVITDKTYSVLWMYKLHSSIHLQSEISFVETSEKLCKFPKGVCFENHFCLYIDYNVGVFNQTGNIIEMYNTIICSVKCIYYSFLHACSLSTMAATADLTMVSLFFLLQSVFKKSNIT